MNNLGPTQTPSRAERESQGSDLETARVALEKVWHELAGFVDEARQLDDDAVRNPSLLNDPWVAAHTRWLQLFDREIKAVEEVYDASRGRGKLGVEEIRKAREAAEKLLDLITTARQRVSPSPRARVNRALRRLQDRSNEGKQGRGVPAVDLFGLSQRIDPAILDSVAQQADEQNLNDAATVATLGVRLRNTGQNLEARPYLEAAAAADDAMAANTLGLISKEGGDREEARRQFRESANRNDGQGQYNLGLMYFEDGDYDEAERWLSRTTDDRAAELLAQIRAQTA